MTRCLNVIETKLECVYFFCWKNLAEKVYSVSAVVSEIKDAKTKEYLQVLPFDFKFKEPQGNHIKFGNYRGINPFLDLLGRNEYLNRLFAKCLWIFCLTFSLKCVFKKYKQAKLGFGEKLKILLYVLFEFYEEFSRFVGISDSHWIAQIKVFSKHLSKFQS